MVIDYNRQYIGARYVPVFFNNPNGSWDWASGFQYEPMTIVQYGGNAFTSKQLVPASVGAPNENPTYWANTGNYNGFISILEEEVATLRNTLAQIYPNNVLIIGDSYLANTQIAENVASQLNLTLIKRATSSMGFVTAVGGETFVNQLTKGSSTQKANTRRVICFGGLNDRNTDATAFTNAIDNFITTAKTTYPNAEITIIGPEAAVSNYKDASIMEIEGIMRTECLNNGVGYASARLWLFNSPNVYGTNFLSDLIHPSEIGSSVIVNKILATVNGAVEYGGPAITNIMEGSKLVKAGTKNDFTIGFRGPATEFQAGYKVLFSIGESTAFIDNTFLSPLYSLGSNNVPTGIIGAVTFQNGNIVAKAFNAGTYTIAAYMHFKMFMS